MAHKQNGCSALSMQRWLMYCANSSATLARWNVNSAGTPSSLPRAHPRKQLAVSASTPSQAACDKSTLGEMEGTPACISSAARTHAE